MKLLYAMAFLFLAACATTPAGLKKDSPDFQHTAKADMLDLTQCLTEKIETYPILTGFEFENRAMPVQLRQFKDKTEIIQMQGMYIMTLIELQNSNGMIASDLYVSKNLISYERTKKAYSGFILKCH